MIIGKHHLLWVLAVFLCWRTLRWQKQDYSQGQYKKKKSTKVLFFFLLCDSAVLKTVTVLKLLFKLLLVMLREVFSHASGVQCCALETWEKSAPHPRSRAKGGDSMFLTAHWETFMLLSGTFICIHHLVYFSIPKFILTFGAVEYDSSFG